MKRTDLTGLLCGLALLLVVAFGTSCASVRARLSGGTSANAPADNGTPARASSVSSVSTVPLPAGSSVETKPGTPETATSPGVAPSVKVTLSAPSELRVETTAEAATTGTIDTEMAKHRITVETEAAERKPLLWTAIGCLVIGVLALGFLKEWPIIGRSFLAASALSGAAWKVAEIPWWAFAVVLLVAGLAVAFYKRAEWDANRDGIPDALQRKPSA
jgi:hypothetical protein